MKVFKIKNIPDGWKRVPVNKIFHFLRTYAISRENLISGTLNDDGIRNIHYGDLHSTYGKPSINLRECSVPLVKDRNFAPRKEDFLIDGDLIMADVSEDYAGIGVTVSVHGLDNKKVVGGLHTFVLRDIHKETIERYRQYIFCNLDIRNKLQKLANGVSVYGISKKNLSKLLLILPPPTEQNRIVSVLETWDLYLEKLERKIQVKKNIKKGLMQQLLTGRKRLNGFKDPWQKVFLGNVAEVLSGGTPDTKVEDYWGGNISWITPSEITKLRGRYIYDTERNINELGLKNSSASLIPAMSLILCSRATIGDCAINMHPITTNQGFKNVVPKKIDIHFLYFLILMKKAYFKKISSGSTFLEFSKRNLEKMELKIPKSNDEQCAISKVLINIDDEIDLLGKKAHFINFQKKFLLDNLVNGKIRTPQNMKVKS